MEYVKFKELLGKSFKRITKIDEEALKFETDNGEVHLLSHDQDCCESVYIEDITGDLDDLLDSRIIQAEEVEGYTAAGKHGVYSESFTWTFYKLGSLKGGVTIRFYGESSGYYSESVDLKRIM